MHTTDLLAAWYLFLFLGFVPYAAIKSARAVRAGAAVPPRSTTYRRTLITELIFLAVSLFAGHAAEIDLWGGDEVGLGVAAAVPILLVLALVALHGIWNITPEDRKRRLLLTRPQETGELGWWFLVSLAAGVVEEVVYRGVMAALVLTALTGRMGGAPPPWPPTLGGDFSLAWWATVAVCVTAFVLGHAGQGLPRAVFLSVFAIACHVLVRATGSLYPAIAFHFLYDFCGGIAYIRFARKATPETA